MATREDVQRLARTWLGVRWRHQGRSALAGVDCAGLVLLVGKALGCVPEDYDEHGYSRAPDGWSLKAPFELFCQEKPISARRPGDIILLRGNSVFPCHVAIMSTKYGVEHVIHASTTHRKVVEEPYQHDLPGNTTHCFEFPGLED